MKNHTQHTQVGMGNQQPASEIKSPQTEQEECTEALGGSFKVVTIPATPSYRFDPLMLLKHKYDDIKRKIKTAVTQHSMKWYLSIQIYFSKPKRETMEQVTLHFCGNCQIALKAEDIDENLQELIKKMYSSFLEYQRQGSNWSLDKILKIQIHLVRYKPIKGSSYIPLPIKLRSKKAIINVQNRD